MGLSLGFLAMELFQEWDYRGFVGCHLSSVGGIPPAISKAGRGLGRQVNLSQQF